MIDQAQNLRHLKEHVAPRKPHRARRIVFLSGKGGVGKTSLSVNVALALARMRKKVLLIDCDIGLANVDLLLGFDPRKTLDAFFKRGDDIREAVVNLPNGLWLLPGSGDILPTHVIKSGRLEEVLLKLDKTADFIIMDGGAGIDEGVRHVARLADEAVVISTPDNTSTIDAYRLIKVLMEEPYHPAIRLIINRSNSYNIALKSANGLINAMKDFLDSEPDYLGWIPYDATLEKAGRERRPLVEKYPASDSARAIVAIAHRLVNPAPVDPDAA